MKYSGNEWNFAYNKKFSSGKLCSKQINKEKFNNAARI